MAYCYTRDMRRRTTIWLGDPDRDAIHTVRERFGLSSDSDAIRLAVRTLARAERVAVWPIPDESKSKQERRDE
jgi:Arc/MetJ family transcription regulator